MKTMRPRIGMTVTQFPEYDGFKLRRDYVRAIEMAGGLPLLIPVCGEELIEDYLDSIDGLLLTGGDDFLPELRHAHDSPGTFRRRSRRKSQLRNDQKKGQGTRNRLGA